MDKNHLKSILPIRILAICFLLAPFGNVILSMITLGIPGWYLPNVFLDMTTKIVFVDWVGLILTFLAGVALFIRHKTSWIIALVTIILITILNIYKGISISSSDSDAVQMYKWHLVVATFSTLSVLIIILFFRYPYLDRRSGWLTSNFLRYKVKLPMKISAPIQVNGQILSLSASGLLGKLDKNVDIAENEWANLEFTVEGFDIPLKGMIVEANPERFRARITNISFGNRRKLSKWLAKNFT